MNKQHEKQLLGKISFGKAIDWSDYFFYGFGKNKKYTLTFEALYVYSQCPYTTGDFVHEVEFVFNNLAEVKWFFNNLKISSVYKGYEIRRFIKASSTYNYQVRKTGKHLPVINMITGEIVL